MERHVLFVKHYSEIASIQSEQKLYYCITRSETGLAFGVSIRRSSALGLEEEAAAHLFSKRQSAESLALFLYEKAVAPEHLFDILHDLKVSGSIDVYS